MRLWAPKECQILNAILLFQLKFRLVYNNARKKDVFSSFRVNIFPYGTRVIFKLSNFFFGVLRPLSKHWYPVRGLLQVSSLY